MIIYPQSTMTSASVSKRTLFSLLLLSSTTTATKHKFVTVRDHRTFIGPIGAPFGFLENGEYSLDVSHFQLKLKDHHRNKKINKKNTSDGDNMDEFLQTLHPGFLLKRFENENAFGRFVEEIYDDVTKCGFEDFIQGGEFAEDDDNNIGIHTRRIISSELDDGYIDDNEDDDYYSTFNDQTAKGKGIIDGGEAGIFMSMKNQEHMWIPKTPSLHHKFTVDEAGFYFLFYQICLPKLDSSTTTDISKFAFKEITSNFLLNFEYINYDMMGKVSYLTAGEMPLPHIYLYFTMSYAIMLILWLLSMKRNFSSSSPTNMGGKPKIYAIHHLMSSVVFLKMLTMLLESIRYHFIRVNGHAEVWSFVYFLTNFFKGTFLFTVILLIGSGWSFFKPFLSMKERRIILFVMVLQIIDNIALAFLSTETESERSYNEWSAILHLVDIICCCAVLVPIVWQVNTLEESTEVVSESNYEGEEERVSSSSSSQTSRLESKLHLFRSFYLIVVVYIYFTRIVIYLFTMSLNYHQTWMRYFIYELGTLTFYFVVGMKFKPVVEVHSYSQLDTTLANDEDVIEKQQLIELSSTAGNVDSKVAMD